MITFKILSHTKLLAQLVEIYVKHMLDHNPETVEIGSSGVDTTLNNLRSDVINGTGVL